MSSTIEADFVWVKEVKEAFARSFPDDYEQLVLERFQQCIEEEMQMSSDQKRLSLLFQTLLDFYNHFCWKVKFKKPSEIMKIGLIRLLATLIKVGLMINYDARLRTILIVLTDEEDLLYSALLLVSRLKKKSQEAYGILLRDVLCTRQLCPSTPETYLKTVLLLRRLQSLTHNKPRHLATPPTHTIQWLKQHCPKALPENPKPHILTNHLLQKKLPSDVLQDLREVLLPFDSKPMGPLKKTHNEETLVSDEDAFTIDSGGLSSHQDKNEPLAETNALKKKKRLKKKERKRKAKEVIAEENESGEDERDIRICQAEKTVNKKKSKKCKRLKIIESKENDGSNLLNETKKEDFVLADNNVEETKSKKKRRKKKKNTSTSLDDKTEGVTPSVEEIGIEEQNADLEVKDRDDLSINTCFERGEESNRSTRKKKKRMLGKEEFSNSFVVKESCDSLPLSKKRKISKTEKLSSSKEKLNDQSCSLSLSSNLGADNEDMNESAVKCRASCDPPSLGSPENMLNSEGPARKGGRKNKKMPELKPITVQTVIKSLEEDDAKEGCIGTTTTEEKEHKASPKKSKKRKSRKCANEMQTSDLMQCAEECVEKKSALDGTRGMDIDSTTEEKEHKASPKKSKRRKSRKCTNELPTSDDLVWPAEECVEKESAFHDKCRIDIKSQFDSVRKELEEETIENKEQMLANPRKRKSKKSSVTVEAENKVEENSDKEKIIDDSSDPQLNKSSSKDLEIKESIAESTGKKSDIYNMEKDSSMPCVSSSSENTLELEKINSTNETTCLEVGNQCPSNLIQEVKEESLSNEVMSFKDSDATSVSSEPHSNDLLKEENEEKPKCLTDKILPPESLSEDSILREFAAIKDEVKNELQIHHQEIAFKREAQTYHIQVLPVFVKKNENSDEESEQLSGIRIGEKVPSNGSSVVKKAVSGTSPKSKFSVAESFFKEELNETRSGNNVRSEAGNLSNRISIKSQSSDSEMSSKEAIINEYDERLSENAEIVISVSDESCAESSSLDKSVKKTNKNPLVSSDKQVTKSKRLCNDKLPSIIESPNYDSDASLFSSLNVEGDESSPKCAAFEKEDTPKITSNKREINIDVESKSSDIENEAKESLSLIKNVEDMSESCEQEVLFTPKKRSRSIIVKHSVCNLQSEDLIKSSQKLKGSFPNSIEIQNISNGDILTEGDKSSINSTILSNDNNEENLNLEAKSCIKNKTNNKRLLGAENGTKDCSVVLVDIFESTGELGETVKKEISAREELVQNVLQRRRLDSEKDSDLNSNHSTHKSSEWTLSYDSDFLDKSDDEKDLNERLTRSKTSCSKDAIKTGKFSSRLRSKKESTNSSDPVQDVVPSGRYNLRRSCKKFPNVKQPHSQRLAPVPRMSFSPLVRKAANFPDFSDVSENLNFDEVEKFNDEYRESPADLTIMVKVEDDVLSNEHELSSLTLEPDNESQPMASTEGAEHLGSENSSDVESSQGLSENGNVESSQGLSENGNDEPSQPLGSKSTCDAPADEIGDSKPSSETIIRISKSRLKVGNSSKRQKPAKGYSLRSRGAATDLELNLERLSIGTPIKNANSIEKNVKTGMPEVPKETKTAEEQRSLRRSKRNLVLPGKLKL